jgi:hypothetical protein
MSPEPLGTPGREALAEQAWRAISAWAEASGHGPAVKVWVDHLDGHKVMLPRPPWGLYLHLEDAPRPAEAAAGPVPAQPPRQEQPLRELVIVQRPPADVPLERQRVRKAWHSPDWRQVHLSGRRWLLSPKQAVVVRLLWEAALEGRPDVRVDYLLTKAESECARLVDLFRRVQGWDVLLVVSLEPGKYRLAEADRLRELLEEEAQREEGLIE